MLNDSMFSIGTFEKRLKIAELLRTNGLVLVAHSKQAVEISLGTTEQKIYRF